MSGFIIVGRSPDSFPPRTSAGHLLTRTSGPDAVMSAWIHGQVIGPADLVHRLQTWIAHWQRLPFAAVADSVTLSPGDHFVLVLFREEDGGDPTVIAGSVLPPEALGFVVEEPDDDFEPAFQPAPAADLDCSVLDAAFEAGRLAWNDYEDLRREALSSACRQEDFS